MIAAIYFANGARHASDLNWKIANTFQTNWNTVGFDDSSWSRSSSLGGVTTSPWYFWLANDPNLNFISNSQYLWTQDWSADTTVYFRYTITDGFFIAENSANGTVVGTVVIPDADIGDTLSYSLTNDADGRFGIDTTTGRITVANSSLLNYEASTSHTIVVRATDVGGLTVDRTLTVTVTNVNDSPRLYGARMVDDFDDGALDGWTPISLGGVTNWAANLGTAQNTSSAGQGFLGRTVAGMQHETAYTISADISWAYNSGGSHNNGVGFVFGYQNDSNYWIARWTDPGSAYSSYASHRDLQLIEVVNGQSHIRGVADQLSLAASFQMELRATANELSVLIDGVARLTVATPPPALRTFGLYSSDNDHGVRYDNVVLETPLASTVQFQEGGAPVVLDSDAVVLDPELSSSNFSGATLTLARSGGSNSQDLFSATGTLGALTQGGNLVVGATTIGTVTTNSSGTLVLTFNSSASNALVNSAIQQIAYANSSDAPPSNVQINWTFSDGNSGAQGPGGALTATGSVTVNITSMNDAPTLNSVTTGLVGWWKMDELNGTSAADSSGNGNIATRLNGATWESGKFGSSARFDGIDDYIVNDLNKSVIGSTPTISLWVKSNSSQSNGILEIGNNLGDGSPWIYLWRDSNSISWYTDGGHYIFQSFNDNE
ncbi:MAG: cadherin repeat domain-containing protein, partial [Planctomycetes bacterium]|nr:cadherin repeat domain-containing protein [Planctomycetota bacterium]